MSTPNYQLKKGVLLQAFGDASKTCTNDTLTDELAQWYLSHYPEKIIYFERVPAAPVPVQRQVIEIIPPVKIIPPDEVKPQELINIINLPEKITVKKTPKGKKK